MPTAKIIPFRKAVTSHGQRGPRTAADLSSVRELRRKFVKSCLMSEHAQFAIELLAARAIARQFPELLTGEFPQHLAEAYRSDYGDEPEERTMQEPFVTRAALRRLQRVARKCIPEGVAPAPTGAA